MSEYINSVFSDESQRKFINARLKVITSFYNKANPSVVNMAPLNDVSNESDTLVFDYFALTNVTLREGALYDYSGATNERVRLGGIINIPEGKRACIIRLKSTPADNISLTNVRTEDKNIITTDAWLLVTNDLNAEIIPSASITSYTPLDAKYEERYNFIDGGLKAFSISTGRISGSKGNRCTPQSIPSNWDASNTVNGIKNRLSLDNDITANIQECLRNIATDSTCAAFKANSDYFYYNGMPGMTLFNNAGGILASPVKIPENIPVFDATKEDDLTWKTNVYNYLVNGVLDGNVNIFEEDETKPVTDFKTDFTLYISPNDKNNTKFSVSSVNRQYNEGRVDLAGKYALYVSEDVPFNVNNELEPNVAQVPVTTFNRAVTNSSEISMYFGEYERTTNYSGCFQVRLIADPTSKSNVKVNTVYWSDYPAEEGVVVQGVAIENGYRYTASSGETLTVLFRAISLDDIKDIIDDGYPDEDDEDNDNTGSDVIPLYGNGLKTYVLTDGAFNEVNNALWTTDWATVFKSSSIDPIKCVITCKRIPFTVGGTSTDVINIANRSIAASSSVVSPIKKYNVARYSIPAIYGNFVDVTMAKVRVYLPFIGWRELPANEVISRVGRAQVGLSSKTYNLGFDYIVDFVDGNVRCIISVNGTERWYFDGNCAIDVPVTSDNHTAAISNAIKAGVSTVMSVGSIAGGAAAGNALAVGAGVLGTVQNGMNVLPTYDFSSSGSPSGYIDGAMNKHIMIVLEYPNAYYPGGYAKKVGLPCMLNLSLGSCSGFTRTVNVDVSGINATADELDIIRNLLNSGVYL